MMTSQTTNGIETRAARRAAIRVEDLVFRYREGDFELALDGIEVCDGDHTAIIGPSGSGKTTLLHLVAGIVLPRSGRIETAGVEVTALDDAARRSFRIQRVGLVFQEFELLEYLDVRENILLPYRINPALKVTAEVRERAAELARNVGLGDKLDRHGDQLSQGERQRVAVCRALVTRPSLLLADEPTGNLDPANKSRVLDILLEQADEHGATLVTVTHDHDLLSRFDKVIDLRELEGATP